MYTGVLTSRHRRIERTFALRRTPPQCRIEMRVIACNTIGVNNLRFLHKAYCIKIRVFCCNLCACSSMRIYINIYIINLYIYIIYICIYIYY